MTQTAHVSGADRAASASSPPEPARSDLIPRRSPAVRALPKTRRAAPHLEERLQRLMLIDTVGIFFFDSTGLVTEANEAFLRMSGYSHAELRAGLLRWEKLVPAAPLALDELNREGRTPACEKPCVRKDGSSWWALLSAVRLSEHEGAEFVVDITDRRRTEAELQRYREQLEDCVLERTAELDSVNGALRDEILERKRAEVTREALVAQLVAVQEEERRRISRELHDVVGQHLTALMLGLKSLEARAGGAPAPAARPRPIS